MADINSLVNGVSRQAPAQRLISPGRRTGELCFRSSQRVSAQTIYTAPYED